MRDTPYKHVDDEDKTTVAIRDGGGREGQNPVAIRDPLGLWQKKYRHKRVGTISDIFIENAARKQHFSKASQSPIAPCAVDTYNLVIQKTWRVNMQFLRWKFA